MRPLPFSGALCSGEEALFAAKRAARYHGPMGMAMPPMSFLRSFFSMKASRARFAVVFDGEDDADAGHDREHRRAAIGE